MTAGVRLPAEWERHEATWLAWPHHSDDWPGKFRAIGFVMAEIVRNLARSERVRLLVRDEKQQVTVRRALADVEADLSQVEYMTTPTDRAWTRDYMPFFVKTADGGTLALKFGFTGWAKYDNFAQDEVAGFHAPSAIGVPVEQVTWRGRSVVLEGGGVDCNGCGDALVTEEFLLHPTIQVRNPGMNRGDYEAMFADILGVSNVIWLGRGIVGDDTHGHIDDLCRFVSRDTVVLCSESREDDANYTALQENRERLEGARLADGTRVSVIALPMPRPVVFRKTRLPASYANFLIGNSVVLVPTFNDPADRQALGILAELFPSRDIIGIHATDLVWGFGTIHCLSHEQVA
ncbi:agmatine deiminase family protein [Desulfovibrio inopinatus]|uniref:agmatine deiminase family protein n=1 Tax=Desulfovibrio inopinatus TaxID=102109 RepID=UPI0004245C76|nr:agmatine deiminase family protein [Desulfovibrio inopinatus]